jgi:hypothetical protein
MSCPIPLDINLQKFWRSHDVVTDEMVKWLKEKAKCMSYESIMDVSNRKHMVMFDGEKIPEDRVAWLKVDTRSGALNVYEKQVFYTDINGRNLKYRLLSYHT